MKRILLLTVVFIMMLGTSFSFAQADADNFYKSDWVKVEKVSFSNQYKMKVAGNLFLPKTMKEGEKYPAIIVGHPMGAVKEQSANLYATKMAERGFVTLSIDLSFWGGSEGEPRNAVLLLKWRNVVSLRCPLIYPSGVEVKVSRAMLFCRRYMRRISVPQ